MPYYATYTEPNAICHYGRLGMKWGKHIFGKDKILSDLKKRGITTKLSEGGKTDTPVKPKGRIGTKAKVIEKADLRSKDYVVKKGSTVSRLSTKKVENVPDARKYVSLTDRPEQKWKDLFTRSYDFVYEHRYKTIKDLKVSSIDKNVEVFTKMVMNDPDFTREVLNSINYHEYATGAKRTGDFTDDFFRSIGMQTEASSKYFKEMASKGYDAIADKYGIETGADQSVIVLQPDKTLKLKSSKPVKK